MSGAALYSSAMAAVQAKQKSASGVSGSSTSTLVVNSAAATPRNNHTPTPSGSSSSPYLTAEEEKAALRYKEAKRAVEYNQGLGNSAIASSSSSSSMGDHDAIPSNRSAPIPYDQLFPDQSGSLDVLTSITKWVSSDQGKRTRHP